MNDMHFLQMLFDGYVICFGKHRWHYLMTYSDATQEEIGHFRDLGLMLGDIPVRETARANLPRPDLVWLSHPMTQGEESVQNSHSVFLHLERENYSESARACVNDQNKKLRYSARRAAQGGYPKYLIGIFGWVTQQDWDYCLRLIKSNPDYSGRNVLLVGCIGNSQEKATDIEGFIWVDNHAYCRKGKCALNRSQDGFWSAYFTSDWGLGQCSSGSLGADDSVSAPGEPRSDH